MSDDAETNVESAPEEPRNGTIDEGVGEDAEFEGLAARVAAVTDELDDEDADELAAEVRDLVERVDELEAENEELRSKLTRKQADFQNYKKRTKKKQEEIKARASEDLVERLLPVRDNLLRALDQDEEADIRPGVESTLSELDHVLEGENVTIIDPNPGDEVDPHRHEVMLRVDATQPEGTVVDRYQPGYEMADKVIRPAQVTVSTGDGGSGD